MQMTMRRSSTVLRIPRDATEEDQGVAAETETGRGGAIDHQGEGRSMTAAGLGMAVTTESGGGTTAASKIPTGLQDATTTTIVEGMIGDDGATVVIERTIGLTEATGGIEAVAQGARRRPWLSVIGHDRGIGGEVEALVVMAHEPPTHNSLGTGCRIHVRYTIRTPKLADLALLNIHMNDMCTLVVDA
jgi:hypothetical protein